MLRSSVESSDPCFDQDMQRIQKSYKMLDDIEHKLKCYLDKGEVGGSDDGSGKESR
jgi:hypothetical protein